MPGHTINVFVSYSHADASLVAPVVRLLRVNKSLVFQDADGITPGTRWRDAIGKALTESNLVVVFWCHHAFQSNEVSSEWRAAIEQGKDLLPLLLDGTPLPSELTAFQWIDFRGTVGANHGAIAAAPPSTPAPRRRAAWSAVAAAALAAVILTSFWTLTRVSYDSTPPQYSPATNPSPVDNSSVPNPANISPAPPVSTPPEDTNPPAAAATGWWTPLLVTAVVMLGAGFLWRGQWRKKRRAVEHRIAAQLEAEIIRRTATLDSAN